MHWLRRRGKKNPMRDSRRNTKVRGRGGDGDGGAKERFPLAHGETMVEQVFPCSL